MASPTRLLQRLIPHISETGKMEDHSPILNVEHLTTAFETENGAVNAVEDVNFALKKGSALGLVGESGCGKSVTALSIMRLLPKPFGKITAGSIHFGKTDLVELPIEEMRHIRGNRISMIFQEPMTALNPVQPIRKQLREVYRLHFPEMTEKEIHTQSIKILREVGIPAPENRLQDYPHQLSGGMRQRIMIAMALACDPDILIADEPTTALDVTIQAQILDLIQHLQEEKGMSIIFITHDLGVIAEMCDEVAVMYAGKVVEKTSVENLFAHPKHPYTRGLLSSVPRLEDIPKQPLNTIKGSVPDLFSLPIGCRFQNRCPHMTDQCVSTSPPPEWVTKEHAVSCFHWNTIS